MFNGLFWLAALVGLIDWVGSERDWKRVRKVTKPGTMVLLIAWFSQVGGWQGPLLWFGLGLVFSMLGDTFLMFTGPFFLAGMGAFFTAHVFTIIGFNQNPIELNWPAALPVLAVAVAFSALNTRIRSGLRSKGETEMTLPVMAYAMILSLMWLSALSTLFRPDWALPAAILVSLGGGLFFLSDSVLAYNRFVRDVGHADLIVMVTYHLAQFCIATGALMQFVP